MKIEKIIQKMLASHAEIDFNDVVKILKHEGWKLDRVRGSHHVFAKYEKTVVLVMHHNVVKSVYVRRIIETLNLEEKYGKK